MRGSEVDLPSPGAAPSAAPASGPLESDRREMSAGTHFVALDGYRAAAALMVVMTHVAFSTGEVLDAGWGYLFGRFDFGVTLFFLLSGFLLYRPWARAALQGSPRPDLRRYAVRRAARVLPLYWVVVGAVLLLLPLLRPVSTSTWIRHLLAIQIYFPEGSAEGLTQTWSLCTEIAFYLVLPLIGMLALGRRRRAEANQWRRQWVVIGCCAAIGVTVVALKGFTSLLPAQSAYWLPFYLDWFAAGMALAILQVRLELPDPPRAARWVRDLARDEVTTVVLAVALFAIVVTPVGGAFVFNQPTGPWEMLAKHLIYALVAFLLLLPAVVAPTTGLAAVMARSGPRRLGLISYGIFLWHVVLIRVVMAWLQIPLFSGKFLLVLAAVLAATILVAGVTYRIIERPAQRWAHRR